MPVGGLLEGIPNTQNQVFLKGFAIDGQANGGPLAGKPTGHGEAAQVKHVANGGMAEGLQIVLGVYLQGGVDRLHQEGGKQSGWQQ
jgi:hypothetical protein